MPKIVVTQDLDLFPDQIEKLKSLGDVTFHKNLADTPEDWLVRVRGFDIICTRKFGLKQKINELHDVFVSLPAVGVGWVDKETIRANNVTLANTPGSNKAAISEWIVGMMINSIRELPAYIDVEKLPYDMPSVHRGLSEMKVTILGAGNIGKEVGRVCEALDMKVKFYRRGDDLLDSVKDADVTIACLSLNADTKGLLDEKFFSTLKPKSYFVSVVDGAVLDEDALFKALDDGVLAGAAISCAGTTPGDGDNPDYATIRQHPKIMATPNESCQTDVTARIANDMMIDNIEAWLKGEPINLVN